MINSEKSAHKWYNNPVVYIRNRIQVKEYPNAYNHPDDVRYSGPRNTVRDHEYGVV